MGHNSVGIVSNSFWDKETCGTEESKGGTGKTTAEMQDFATYKDRSWDIVAVSDPNWYKHTWNIVDGQTYPFLS